MSGDRQAVLDRNAEFYRAFAARELTAMADVWSHGSAISCIHPGRTALVGWDQVRASWQSIFTHTDELEIDIDPTEVTLSSTVAVVVLTETVLQISGRRRFKAVSMATNVFEKLGDRWYLIHHHGSPIA